MAHPFVLRRDRDTVGNNRLGIILDPLSPAAAVDALEPASVAVLPELSSSFAAVSGPHASTTDKPANTTISAKPRRHGSYALTTHDASSPNPSTGTLLPAYPARRGGSRACVCSTFFSQSTPRS
jgi:hypothetical protein